MQLQKWKFFSYIFLQLVLILTLGMALSSPLYAQGQFICNLQPISGACVVDGASGCAAGFRPDPSFCSQRTTANCGGASAACIPNQNQQAQPGQNTCVQMPAGGCAASEATCPLGGLGGLAYCCTSTQACQELRSSGGNVEVFNSGSAQNQNQQPTQIRPQECNVALGGQPALPNNVGWVPGQIIGAQGFPVIETALGCIPTDPAALIAWLFKWGLSIGGGIAFLLMAFGGFLLLTSSGNPERIKGGQELITSAFVGLLFIIFSVFLLRLIGFQILAIPGFG